LLGGSGSGVDPVQRETVGVLVSALCAPRP
jgi:hypothetical protein